jgi:hypothetical protein
MMEPRISIVTRGVVDLDRAVPIDQDGTIALPA